MDAELRRVVDALPPDTLLVVMGDHGMTPDGNHGGGTDDETRAALMLYSKEGSLRPRARLLRDVADVPAVRQLDLVPTLCLALGLPIPFANLGALIPDVVGGEGGADGDRLRRAYRLNAGQVWHYLRAYASATNQLSAGAMRRLEVLFERASEAARSAPLEEPAAWEAFLRAAQGVALRQWATFDVPTMAAGLIVAAAVSALVLVDAVCGRVSLPLALRARHAQRADAPFQGLLQLANPAGRSLAHSPSAAVEGILAALGLALAVAGRPAAAAAGIGHRAVPLAAAVIAVAAAAVAATRLVRWHSRLQRAVGGAPSGEAAGRASALATALRLLAHPRLALALLLAVFHCIGLLTNSYIVAQPAAVQFLAGSLALCDLLACARGCCPPRELAVACLPLLCARLAHAGAGSWHGHDGVAPTLLLSVAPLVVVPLAVYLELARTDTVRGAGLGVVFFSLLAGGACAAQWGLTSVGVWARASAAARVFLPRVTLGLCALAFALALYQPLTATAFLLKRRGAGQEEETSIKLLGVPRGARSSLILPLLPLLPAAALLLGPRSPALLLLWALHMAGLAGSHRALATAAARRPGPAGPTVYATDVPGGDDALEQTLPRDRAAGLALAVLLAAWHYYFASGHSNNVNGVDFAAGFTAVTSFSLLGSGLLVVLNTAAFHLLSVLALPAVLVAATSAHAEPLPARSPLDPATARAAEAASRREEAAVAAADAHNVDGGSRGDAGPRRRGTAVPLEAAAALKAAADAEPVSPAARALHWASQWSSPDMGVAALPDPSRAAEALAWLLFFAGAATFSAMLCAFALRRHLMVWAVFAPKLLFEVAAIAIVLVASVAAWAMFTRVWTAIQAFMVYNVWCYAQTRPPPM